MKRVILIGLILICSLSLLSAGGEQDKASADVSGDTWKAYSRAD